MAKLKFSIGDKVKMVDVSGMDKIMQIEDEGEVIKIDPYDEFGDFYLVRFDHLKRRVLWCNDKEISKK